MTSGSKQLTPGDKLTVGAGFARGLMALCVSKGAGAEALAAASGIDAAALHDQDQRIPFAQYVALMRAGQKLTGDPALALHYGEIIDFADISIVGLICDAAETMLDALQQTNRYGRLVVEVEGLGSDRFVHSVEGGQLWLADTRKNPNDFPELTESTFARMTCGMRRFGDARLVKAVHVTHAEPAYRDEYDRIFAAPIVFGSDKNALAIDAAWLTRPIALLPRYVFGVLSKHAEALLAELEGGKSTRGRVESLLMAVLHTGNANIDLVARKLGLSRQTLYRKLKGEGVSFEKVLDELRHRLALHYLDGNKASINEIAYLVGFSEPAAFSRAFKRWTGASPRDYLYSSRRKSPSSGSS
jgi:AraC-like DNA-binding protein